MDPDSNLDFHFGTDQDQDPTFRFDADLDPAPHQCDPTLPKALQSFTRSLLGFIESLYGSKMSLRGSLEPPHLPTFGLDADPDPDF